MVAGVSNKVHCVTPGKDGSLSCDRNCVNFTTKICDHIIAVVQHRGTLPEYISWYKRAKRGPSVTDMAAAGGPKSAGRKPSSRQRSNVKAPPVQEYVDLLQNGSTGLPQKDHGNPVSRSSQSSSVSSPTTVPFVALQNSDLSNSRENHMASQHVPSQHFFPSFPYQHVQHPAMSFMMSAANSRTVFVIKCVPGMTVSRCYGCGGDIQNPPLYYPDDLIVMYRDKRQYRDRNTGQLVTTGEPQNVHFHLRFACV